MALSIFTSLTTKIQSLLSLLPSSSSSASRASNLSEEIKKLSSRVGQIRARLADAEEREITDQFVRHWLFDLKQLAYDAEQILEDFSYELLRREIKHNEEQKRKADNMEITQVNNNPYLFSDDVFNEDMLLHKIREIRERFDEIDHDQTALSFREEDGARLIQNKTRALLPSSSGANINEIYGRENEREEIVRALFDSRQPTDDNCFEIISIVAMGGMGKTTLAKLVYNDFRVQKHFNLRSWVWVSEVFDETRLAKAMLESVTGQACKLEELESVQKILESKLNGKKLLLILDDTWNEDPFRWGIIQELLSSTAKGSRVIITTRNEEVARTARTKLLINLKGLNASDGWALFCRHARLQKEFDDNPNLVEIGKKIVHKCKGVPLVIRTLVGFLSLDTEEEYWKEILEKELWELEESKMYIMPILRFSYSLLPSPLKPCFTFCAALPRGYEFKVEDLIMVWEALGLIQMEDSIEMEKVGRSYVEELVRRSFFQYREIYHDPKKWFTMHDLIYDLAKSISGEESLAIDYKGSNAIRCSEHLHHLSIRLRDLEDLTILPIDKSFFLRSLLIPSEFDHVTYVKIDVFRLLGLQYLQVLDLRAMFKMALSESVGNLRHLRFLAFCSDKSPQSICKLHKLQTLIIEFLNDPTYLPKNFTGLMNLRHLILPSILYIPSGIGGLNKLQTIPSFPLSERSDCASLSELGSLNNIQGKVCISDLNHLKHSLEAKKAHLIYKKNLTSLTLEWTSSSSYHSVPDDKEVLGYLQPCLEIQHVEIKYYRAVNFPKWLGYPSFKIVELALTGCEHCDRLPALGQLQNLKHLSLIILPKIKSIGEEFYGTLKVSFPSLQSLFLRFLEQLEEWSPPEFRTIFPQLRQIEIKGCRNIASVSFLNLPALEKICLSRCKNLKRVIGLQEQFNSEVNTSNRRAQSAIGFLPSSYNPPSLQRLHCKINEESSYTRTPSKQSVRIVECPYFADSFPAISSMQPNDYFLQETENGHICPRDAKWL